MEKVKQIDKLTVSSLSNGVHFEFMDGFVKRVSEFSAGSWKRSKKADRASDAAKFMAKAAALSKSLKAEDAAMQGSRKSDTTKRIAEADAKRGSLYAGYKKAVRIYTVYPEPDKVSAAKRLLSHVNDYRIDTTTHMDNETGLLKNFIADLESPSKFKPQIDALGLKSFVKALKECNALVSELIAQRDKEFAGYVKGALKNARSDMDEAYHDVVRFMNALAVVDGDDEYSSFFDAENAVINRVKKTLSRRGSSQSKNDDTLMPGNEIEESQESAESQDN